MSVTSSGALEGLGKGIPSLLISLCRYIFIIIPTAFLLSRILGVVGIWHAFSAEINNDGNARFSVAGIPIKYSFNTILGENTIYFLRICTQIGRI